MRLMRQFCAIRAVDRPLRAQSILQFQPSAINRESPSKYLRSLTNHQLEAMLEINGVNGLNLDLNEISHHLRRMRHFCALQNK
jgi:hypothetical protein